MTTRTRTCGPVTEYRREDNRLVLHHRQGTTRIEAPAEGILRVRFTPEGDLMPQRSWDVVEDLGACPLQSAEADGQLAVQVGVFRIGVDRSSGALSFQAHGHVLARDRGGPRWGRLQPADTALPHDAEPSGRAGLAVALDKELLPDEHVYGLGQRTGRMERRHRRVANWASDPASPGYHGHYDNLYQAHPVLVTVRPGLSWGLFLHSTWYSDFDVGAEREDTLRLLTAGGELDYYLFAGPTPAAVLEQLTRLTGRPALPPLWALGYHQSRWSYANADEVAAIAAEFRERDLPLDAIHLDIDYMRGFRVFTWDPERFPDPAALMQGLDARGIKAVAIIDPGAKRDETGGYPVADEGLRHDYFIRNADGSLFSGYVWPGESLFPDFARSDVRGWWGEQHRDLLDAGVDGIWDDMNEPAIVDRPFEHTPLREHPVPLDAPQGADHEHTTHAEVHNCYGALMARATHEGMRRLQPQRRPFVLTRSAYTGSQRHALTWMGDNTSRWEDLALSLPQLASMGLVGMPHVGVDIGGFWRNGFGDLYARWIEAGAFYPFMRTHTAAGTRRQEPWSFGPDVEAVAREALRLRYRLLPYLYTLAHLAHRTGAPLLRPLVYEFPDQSDLYHVEDQVMLGPWLMVAPVTEPGVRRRLVRRPPGVWYDFWTGRRLEDDPLVMPAPPGQPPVMVRGGALLTLGNPRPSTVSPLTELTVAVYPGDDGRWQLIEDDGLSMAYQQGHLAETPMTVTNTDGALELTIGPRTEGFQPHPRSLALQVHLPAPPATVIRDGAQVRDWQWLASASAIALQWPDDGRLHHIQVSGPGLD